MASRTVFPFPSAPRWVRASRVAVLVAACAVGCTVLNGCAVDDSKPPSWSEAKHDSLSSTVSASTSALLAQLPPSSVTNPLLVASVQNLNTLEQSAPFGRLIGEMVASQATRAGYPVVETRLTRALRMTPEGTLLLSGEAQDVANSHKANVVIVGSWSAAGRIVYVSLKALRASDGLVLATQEFTLPKNSNIDTLLRPEKKESKSPWIR